MLSLKTSTAHQKNATAQLNITPKSDRLLT